MIRPGGAWVHPAGPKRLEANNGGHGHEEHGVELMVLDESGPMSGGVEGSWMLGLMWVKQ